MGECIVSFEASVILGAGTLLGIPADGTPEKGANALLREKPLCRR